MVFKPQGPWGFFRGESMPPNAAMLFVNVASVYDPKRVRISGIFEYCKVFEN
jgi:hypothetical protein